MIDHAVSEPDVSDDKDPAQREPAEPPQGEPSPEEQQRIAELEAEVARLRQKLGSAARDGLITTRDGAGLALDPEEEALDLNKKAGIKAVLIAVAVVAVGLGLIFGVYSALAKGFDAFAKKAAEKIVGGKDDSPENAVGGGVAVDPSVAGVGGAKKGATKQGAATKGAATKGAAKKGDAKKGDGAGKTKPPIQLPGM